MDLDRWARIGDGQRGTIDIQETGPGGLMQENCPRCGSPIGGGEDVCRRCGFVLEDHRGPGDPAGPADEPPPPPPPPDPHAPPPPPSPPPPSDVAAGTARYEQPPPWERWREVGFWSALWSTWRDSVFRPVAFFRALPSRNGFGPPLWYAILMTAIGFFFSFYWSALQGIVAGSPEFTEIGGELGALFAFVAFLFALVFVIPLYIGLLFVGAGIVHLGFMAAGAGRQGYEGTFRAIAYASGPAVFSIFPFFGPLVSGLWAMVLWYIGMREVQRTTNGRAVLGFLIPVIAMAVVFMLFAMLLGLLIGTLEQAVTV